MCSLLNFFDIHNTFVVVFGYSMSYLEFFGTILNIWSVWLVTRNNILTWPIGNLAVILFGILFYQIRLYSDFIEQIYFLITGFYGWWVWACYKRSSRTVSKLAISNTSGRENLIYAVIVIAGTWGLGFFMSRIHVYLPKLLHQPASFPYLDAFTTVLSFAATILMAYKKIQCWYLWIVVDVVGIGLYFTKQVIFVSLLYGIFLVLATKGLINWSVIFKTQETSR